MMFIPFADVAACDAKPSDALAAVPGNAGAAVVLVIGLEHWEQGEYTLRVAGDGRVSLKNRRSGAEREWTAQWDPARVVEFVDQLRADGFLSVVPPAGQRQPGDVPLVFRVEGPIAHEVRLWEADRYTLPGVDRIVTRLDALTRELER
jgi:hypothetical protein